MLPHRLLRRKTRGGIDLLKFEQLQFPASNEDNSMLLNQISVYGKNALWNTMESWFDGGEIVVPGNIASGAYQVFFCE